MTEAVEWARSRPDIDGHRIGLWGASQAGWVMPKVAAGASTSFGFLGAWNGGNSAPTPTCTAT